MGTHTAPKKQTSKKHTHKQTHVYLLAATELTTGGKFQHDDIVLLLDRLCRLGLVGLKEMTCVSISHIKQVLMIVCMWACVCEWCYILCVYDMYLYFYILCTV